MLKNRLLFHFVLFVFSVPHPFFVPSARGKGAAQKTFDTLFGVSLILNHLMVDVHLMLRDRPCEARVVGRHNHIGGA